MGAGKACVLLQTSTSEIVLASVVYLNKVRMDRGMTQAEWNNTHALRHFSILRKLDGRPFPPGQANQLSICNSSTDRVLPEWKKSAISNAA